MSSRIFDGKVAIVTGASRGLGVAIAHNLASKGADIVINYSSSTSTSTAQELARDLQTKYSVRALAAQADIASPDGPAKLISLAKTHLTSPDGHFQIDILINNAAVVNPAEMGKVTIEEFDSTFALNTRAPIMLVQAAMPYLPHDRSGRIVNVSSITTSVGFWWQTCYAGTKGALEAMTRVWARELAERCTVNAINPGPMATGMLTGLPESMLEKLQPLNYLTPLSRTRLGVDSEQTIKEAEELGGRPAYCEEVAGIVSMVCSPEAGWMTGNVVGANGGQAMVRA